MDPSEIQVKIFSVSAGADAYSVDIENYTKSFDVMRIFFSYSIPRQSTDGISDDNKNKYTIYISSSPDHTDSAHFVLRQIGSEHLSESLGRNALEYELAFRPNNGTASEMSFSSSSVSYGSDQTGGHGLTSSEQYYIRPEFISTQTKFKGNSSGSDQFSYSWYLDVSILLKIKTSATVTTEYLNNGLYESNLYVIVETAD